MEKMFDTYLFFFSETKTPCPTGSCYINSCIVWQIYETMRRVIVSLGNAVSPGSRQTSIENSIVFVIKLLTMHIINKNK